MVKPEFEDGGWGILELKGKLKQGCYYDEGLFCEALQKRAEQGLLILDKLIRPKEEIIWIGREFGPHGGKKSDFTGVDKSGYIVNVEVKVNQTPKNVVGKISAISKTYFDVIREGDLYGRIKRYVAAKINRGNERYFMGPIAKWWFDKEKSFNRNIPINWKSLNFPTEEYFFGITSVPKPKEGIRVFIIGPTTKKLGSILLDINNLENKYKRYPGEVLITFIETNMKLDRKRGVPDLVRYRKVYPT